MFKQVLTKIIVKHIIIWELFSFPSLDQLCCMYFDNKEGYIFRSQHLGSYHHSCGLCSDRRSRNLTISVRLSVCLVHIVKSKCKSQS